MPPTPDVQTIPPGETAVELERPGMVQSPFLAYAAVVVTKPRSRVRISYALVLTLGLSIVFIVHCVRVTDVTTPTRYLP